MTISSPSGPAWKVKSKFKEVQAPPPVPPSLPPHRLLGGTHGSNKTWMISFTDIMGLMLTFFVMMFAMSDHGLSNQNAASGVEGRPSRAFNGNTGQAGDVDVVAISRVQYARGLDIGYLTQILEAKRESVPAFSQIRLIHDDESIFLALPIGVLLDSKGSVLTNDQTDLILRSLDEVLRVIPNDVQVGVEWPASSGFYDGVARAMESARSLRRVMADSSKGKNMKIFIPAKGREAADSQLNVLFQIVPLKPRAS